MTWAVFRDSGKTPCSNYHLMIKLSRADKILTLSLRIVTGTLNRTKAFPLFKRSIVFLRHLWCQSMRKISYQRKTYHSFKETRAKQGYDLWGYVLKIKKTVNVLTIAVIHYFS